MDDLLFEDKGRVGRNIAFKELKADSVKNAWYTVSLDEHPNGPQYGYLITRRSGAARSKGCAEVFFRSSLQEATLKFELLIGKKLAKKSGRIYVPVQQPALF